MEEAIKITQGIKPLFAFAVFTTKDLFKTQELTLKSHF